VTVSEPEALSLIEFASIAAGTRAVDALIKKAPVKVERMGTLQPGKLAVLFSGNVASVEQSHTEAVRVGGPAVADQMLLAHVHADVYRAALGRVGTWTGDTLGIIECSSMAAVVVAADAAVKGAEVRVVRIRLGDELGGKGVAHFVGEQHDVEAALEIGTARVRGPERIVMASMTPRMDEELRALLSNSTRFWGES
jgi:bacterial microcompartment shell protein